MSDVNKIIEGKGYKPWLSKENYTAHHSNGSGLVNFNDAEGYCKELPKLHMFMHDSGMVCTHNIPCTICKVEHAVFVTSSGYCEPCRKCQDKGWFVGFKKKKPQSMTEWLINWLEK